MNLKPKVNNIEKTIDEQQEEEQEINELLVSLKKKQQELDKKLFALRLVNTKE